MGHETSDNEPLGEYDQPMYVLIDNVAERTEADVSALLAADAGSELTMLDSIDADPFDLNALVGVIAEGRPLRRSDLQGQVIFLTSEQLDWAMTNGGRDHLLVVNKNGKTKTIRRGCIPPGRELVILEFHLS